MHLCRSRSSSVKIDVFATKKKNYENHKISGWAFYFSIPRSFPFCCPRRTCHPANHLHAPWWTLPYCHLALLGALYTLGSRPLFQNSTRHTYIIYRTHPWALTLHPSPWPPTCWPTGPPCQPPHICTWVGRSHFYHSKSAPQHFWWIFAGTDFLINLNGCVKVYKKKKEGELEEAGEELMVD